MSGYKLKFYENERKEYPEIFNMDITQSDAYKITKKITRHYKFKMPTIKFRYNTQHGLAKYDSWIMNLPKQPTLGLLLHELAHFHNEEKKGNGYHNKKLMTVIRRFIKYCKRMGLVK